MKTGILVSLMLVSGFTWAQEEYDDMYFNSKDRVKVQERSERQSQLRMTTPAAVKAVDEVKINPTDSYSGRGENPEYQARFFTNPSSQEMVETGYFLAGYQPVGVNQNLAAWPNNSANRWGNSWMMNPWMMGPGYGFNSGWGSPWGWNDPWMMRPGFNSGWGLGFGWNSWNMWGSPSMSFWNSWNNPSWGMGWASCWSCSSWGGGWHSSWGGGFGWNPWGWNRPVIINVGNEGRHVVYQRRQDRSSSLDNTGSADTRQSQPSYTRTGRETNSGRSRSEASSDYYDRTWRSRSEGNSETRTSWSGGNSTTRSSWSSGNSNSNGRSSSFESGPSRSSWSGGNTGGGSRSSFGGGGSSGGSSSGGSRGRGRD